jgi:hypothetical protein
MKIPLLVRMPLKELAWSLAFGLAAAALISAALILGLVWLYHQLLLVMRPDEAMLLMAGFTALLGVACAVLAITRHRRSADKPAAAAGSGQASPVDPTAVLGLVSQLTRDQPLAATSAALLAGFAAGASPALRQGLVDVLTRAVAPPEQ